VVIYQDAEQSIFKILIELTYKPPEANTGNRSQR